MVKLPDDYDKVWVLDWLSSLPLCDSHATKRLPSRALRLLIMLYFTEFSHHPPHYPPNDQPTTNFLHPADGAIAVFFVLRVAVYVFVIYLCILYMYNKSWYLLLKETGLKPQCTPFIFGLLLHLYSGWNVSVIFLSICIWKCELVTHCQFYSQLLR